MTKPEPGIPTALVMLEGQWRLRREALLQSRGVTGIPGKSAVSCPSLGTDFKGRGGLTETIKLALVWITARKPHLLPSWAIATRWSLRQSAHRSRRLTRISRSWGFSLSQKTVVCYCPFAAA